MCFWGAWGVLTASEHAHMRAEVRGRGKSGRRGGRKGGRQTRKQAPLPELDKGLDPITLGS